MNLQVMAIRSDADNANDQNVTHYQLLNWDSFTLATLSKPQAVAMAEAGTPFTVAGPEGQQISCEVNVQGTEKWLQGKENDEWTNDILALPRIHDINGAKKARRFTTKGTNEVNQNE